MLNLNGICERNVNTVQTQMPYGVRKLEERARDRWWFVIICDMFLVPDSKRKHIDRMINDSNRCCHDVDNIYNDQFAMFFFKHIYFLMKRNLCMQ